MAGESEALASELKARKESRDCELTKDNLQANSAIPAGGKRAKDGPGERLIQTITGKAGSVKIYYNSAFEEYVCKPVGKRSDAAANFTNDKQDALDTAKAMSNDPRYF